MKIKCSFCDRLGHNESVCYVKKKLIRKKIRLILVQNVLISIDQKVHKRLRKLRSHVSTVTNLIIKDRMLLLEKIS